jgi:hypothetical protein
MSRGRPGQAELPAERSSAAFRAEQAAPPQLRDDQFGETVDSAGQVRKDEIETIGGGRAEPFLAVVGDRIRRATMVPESSLITAATREANCFPASEAPACTMTGLPCGGRAMFSGPATDNRGPRWARVCSFAGSK